MNKRSLYKRKIIYALVFSLVMIGLFMFIKPSLKSNEYCKENFWANKTYPEPNFEVILFGDSRVYRGLNPEIMETKFIEAGFQYKVLNAGYSSAGLEKSYIDYFLNRMSHKVKLVIFGISPNEFTDDAVKNEHFNGYLRDSKSDIIIKRKIYPYLTGLNVYSLKSLFQNATISDRILKEEFMTNGFVKSDTPLIDSSAANKSYIDNFRRQKVNPIHIDNFLSLVGSLSKRGIHVIAFEMPIAYQLKQIEDSLSGFSREKFKNDFSLCGGIWLYTGVSKLNLVNYDGSHLNARSADFFSAYTSLLVVEHL